MLPRDVDEARRRLERAGWVVEYVRVPLMVIETRDIAGGHGGARRGGVRGHFHLALDCEDGDTVDVYCRFKALMQREGRAKLYVSAVDEERGREELAALEPTLRSGTLEALIAAATARGWQVDRARTADDDYDGGRHLEAARDGEELSIGSTESGYVSAQVRSRAGAAEMLAALLAE